jgi:hypothetical protein
MRRYEMKILEELWYGNVTPGERSVEKGSHLWNLGRLILQKIRYNKLRKFE